VLRFKCFVGSGAQLEAAVNAWLETYEPEVTQMSTSAAGDGLSVTFLFDESFRGQERRLAEQRGMSVDERIDAPERSMSDDPVHVAMDTMG
jgi:hypothetical protein